MFSALLALLFYSSLWGALCLGIYALLRLALNRVALLVSVFGVLALGLQVLALCAFALLLGFNGFDDGDVPSPPPPPYPLGLLLGVVGVWFGSLALGATLVFHTTQKRSSWWRGFRFCAFYLLAAPGISWCVCFVCWRFGGSYPSTRAYPIVWLFDSWQNLWKSAGLDLRWNGGWNAFSLFLLWIFPLGAPLAELAFRSFQCAHKTNTTGSLQ